MMRFARGGKTLANNTIIVAETVAQIHQIL